jgi:hypothetical protein
MKKIFSAGGVALVFALIATAVFAASGYSFFGEAGYISPGNASSRAAYTVSDASPGYGGIDFDIPAGTTFADLQSLSTDYNVTDDNCGGGSPRFQVNVTNGTNSGSIMVYLGPPPAYALCPPNVWVNSGDLLEGVNPIDTSQLPAGTFYDPYAVAVTKYGSYLVTGVQLVIDSSWNPVATGGDGEQTVWFDNTNIDGTLYTYEPNVPGNKEQCKRGGWQNLEDANGQPFKNEGQCVSYFNHNP